MPGSERTEEKILRAACEIASELGADALTTRAVAQRAGVSPGSVHHHYINKEGLVDACIDVMYSKLNELSKQFHDIVAKIRSVGEFVAYAVRTTWAIARDHQPMLRMLVITSAQHGQLDPTRMDETVRPFLATAAPALAAMTGLSEVDVRVRVQVIALAVARFAISSDEELQLITKSTDPAVIENHLVTSAQALFATR